MDDYLSKPVRLNQLMDKLKNLKSHSSIPKQDHRIDQNRQNQEPNTVDLDSQAILELQEMIGEEDFSEVFADLIETYLSDSPNLIEALITGANQKDISTVRINAHSLKSSSATLGATEFAQLCKQIELYCNQDELAQATSLIPQLQEQYQQVESLLKNKLTEIS